MYMDFVLFGDLIDDGHSYSNVMGAGFHVCFGKGLYWRHMVAPIMVSTVIIIHTYISGHINYVDDITEAKIFLKIKNKTFLLNCSMF